MQLTAQKRSPTTDHEMQALARFHQSLIAEIEKVSSTAQLLRHPRFTQERKKLEKVLKSNTFIPSPSTPQVFDRDFLRVAAWNLERGMAYEGITETLKTNPLLSKADIYLFTEVDFGMARSGNRFVAKDLVCDLNLYGVYAPAYLNLDKGNGAEGESVTGTNTVAIQGHAILSRYPIVDTEVIHLPNAKDHMGGKERQIGQESAIIATIQTPLGRIHCAAVHLAAHSQRKDRVLQMKTVLNALSKKKDPIIIGGDWNTTTYNAYPPYRAILGFWRRVAMGVHNTILNHYPYPERYFERRLFATLENYGFKTDPFNVKGGCTFHQDFNDPFVRASIGDWLPNWCYPFVDWALKPRNGVCSFKLDWFAGRNLKSLHAEIIGDLPRNEHRYSDHDPIVTDIQPVTSKPRSL